MGCWLAHHQLRQPQGDDRKGDQEHKPHAICRQERQHTRAHGLELHALGNRNDHVQGVCCAGLRADFARDADVPFLDVVATYDPREKRVAVFALNRDLTAERELALTFEDVTPSRVLACETVTGPDLKAFNTFESPNKVVATTLDPGKAGAKMTVKLPARSYTALHLAVS